MVVTSTYFHLRDTLFKSLNINIDFETAYNYNIKKFQEKNTKSLKMGTMIHYTSKYNILEVLSIDRGKLNEREWVLN